MGTLVNYLKPILSTDRPGFKLLYNMETAPFLPQPPL